MCSHFSQSCTQILPQAYSQRTAQKNTLQQQTCSLSPLQSRPNDYSSEGFNDWAFMTTHSWDEDPQGEWTLEIENTAANGRDYGNQH